MTKDVCETLRILVRKGPEKKKACPPAFTLFVESKKKKKPIKTKKLKRQSRKKEFER